MMTRDDVIELLQVVQAYDNRDISSLTIATWSKSADIAHWPRDAAFDAVHAHFANSTAWIMPGHVTERIRNAARQPRGADEVLALDKPVASTERRAEFMRQIRELANRKAMP